MMKKLRSKTKKMRLASLFLCVTLTALTGCKTGGTKGYYDENANHTGDGTVVVDSGLANDGYRHFAMMGSAIDYTNGEPGGYVQLTYESPDDWGSVFSIDPIDFSKLPADGGVRSLTVSFDFLIGTQDYGEDAAAPTWFSDGEGIAVSLSRSKPTPADYTTGSNKMGYVGFAGAEIDVNPTAAGDPPQPHVASLSHNAHSGIKMLYGDGDLTRAWHHFEFRYRNTNADPELADMGDDTIQLVVDDRVSDTEKTMIDIPFNEEVYIVISAATSADRASAITISNVNVNGSPVVFSGAAYETFDPEILTKVGAWTTNPDGHVGCYGHWLTNPDGSQNGNFSNYVASNDDVEVVFLKDGHGYWYYHGYYGIMSWQVNSDGTVSYSGWGAKPVGIYDYEDGDAYFDYYHMQSYVCYGFVALEGDENTGYILHMSNPFGDTEHTAYVPRLSGGIILNNTQLAETDFDLLLNYSPYELVMQHRWTMRVRQHWDEDAANLSDTFRPTRISWLPSDLSRRCVHIGVFNNGIENNGGMWIDDNMSKFDFPATIVQTEHPNTMRIFLDGLPGTYECEFKDTKFGDFKQSGEMYFNELNITMFVTIDGIHLAIDNPNDPYTDKTDYYILMYHD